LQRQSLIIAVSRIVSEGCARKQTPLAGTPPGRTALVV
jgi:hypothetical protein